jgi:hypothetical protein
MPIYIFSVKTLGYWLITKVLCLRIHLRSYDATREWSLKYASRFLPFGISEMRTRRLNLFPPTPPGDGTRLAGEGCVCDVVSTE